jgi:putative oxidoreductase
MKFLRSTPAQADVALLILRVITGIVFMAHGGQKLFVYGFEGVAGAFAQMGVPMAAIAGPAVGLLEFFGGFALIAGLLTRVVSLGLGATMIGAILLVHASAGFFLPNGYEFVLTLLGAAGALMVAGAGRYSADAVIAARSQPKVADPVAVRRAA